MYDPNNIFAKIIRKELPSDVVYEDEKVIAINDIYPAAPVHVLVLPKGDYESYDAFCSRASSEEIAYFFSKVKDIAKDLELLSDGYRLLVNHGKDGSQTVPHFHLHILGGRKLGPMVVGDKFHGRQTS